MRSLEVARDRELRGQRLLLRLEADMARRMQALEQLREYGREYRSTLSPAAGSTLSTHTLVRTSAFLTHLDEAIEKQLRQICQLRDSYEQEKLRWDEQRRSRAALDKYVSRVQREVRQKQMLADIRAMDDHPRRHRGFDSED